MAIGQLQRESLLWLFVVQFMCQADTRRVCFVVLSSFQRAGAQPGLPGCCTPLGGFRPSGEPYKVITDVDAVNGTVAVSCHARAFGMALATPHLEFGYKPRDFGTMREMGASWKLITEKMPEPVGIGLHGLKE